MNRFYRNYNYYNTRYYDEKNTNSNYIMDYGPKPFATNIKNLAKQNNAFRRVLWTGGNLQITLMSIPAKGSIGLEIHPNVDQFIQIEQGMGIIKMGDSQSNLDFQKRVGENFAFIIPAGKWHDLVNTGNEPIKLFSIYAPPQHPKGTVHLTKEDAKH